jgi:formate C-acetyltransferase
MDTAGFYASSVLRLMAAYFRLSPTFRRNILDGKDGRARFEFNARAQFRALDDSVCVYAVFDRGRMKVGRGKIANPDLTFNFKSPRLMQSFFSVTAPADPMIMLLENNLFIEGNLMYLAKFGHLSKEMTLGRKKRKLLARRKENPRPPDYNPAARSSHPLTHRASLKALPHDQVKVLAEPFLSSFSLFDFPRLQAVRESLFTTPAAICTERPRLLTEYFLEHGFEQDSSGRDWDPGVRQAEALRHILAHRRPVIRDWDLLAGTTTTREVGVLLFPEFGAVALWPELLTVDERELNPYRISAEDIDILNFTVFPFWTDRNIMEYTRRKYENPRCQQLEGRWVLYFCWKAHAVSHTIPDFPMILQRGLLDLIREAAAKEKAVSTEKERNFYRAMQIAQEGVLAYARNLSRKALELAAALDQNSESGRRRRRELEAMAAVCARVPAYPARTLQEALNSIWICWVALHMENMNAGLSLGRLDQVLQPYFLQDLAGAATAAERDALVRKAIELTGCFYLKCADHLPNVPDLGNRLFGGSSSDQALTLGGVDREGNSAVYDMTYIFLKVTEMLGLREPNVNARYHPAANSPEYLKRLIEVNTITAATPSLHNDAVIVPALVNQGFALADARDWGATGCVEPTSCGRHMGHTNCMLLNTVAPLEMALHNGVHPLLGEQVGPQTGDPAAEGTFPAFEDFMDAYKAQLGYLIDRSIEYNNLLGRSHQEQHPTPLLSSFFDGPMERAKDVIDGGARYNTSGAALVSITDVIDSLTAIRELIYEQKAVDWRSLLEALRRNFEGYEALHARIMARVPKFGTGALAPRRLGQELIDFIYDRYQAHTNYRGGKYTSGFWSMSNHVAFGTLSGALPSGRFKGKPFTPGITPSPGVTDQLLPSIHTIAGLDPLKMPNNIAFNVKVAPGPQDTHQAFVERVAAYAKTYFDLGGMQMQFNIVTTAMLKEAVAHPEDFRWLLVRISGYNAYFVELNKEMQQELIERTEFNLGAQYK